MITELGHFALTPALVMALPRAAFPLYGSPAWVPARYDETCMPPEVREARKAAGQNHCGGDQ